LPVEHLAHGSADMDRVVLDHSTGASSSASPPGASNSCNSREVLLPIPSSRKTSVRCIERGPSRFGAVIPTCRPPFE
jgi:hypothetical protein